MTSMAGGEGHSFLLPWSPLTGISALELPVESRDYCVHCHLITPPAQSKNLLQCLCPEGPNGTFVVLVC
jgi:hypothetical protein